MVEFSKGALMKSFKHVALAITATATLAGAGMAQAQDYQQDDQGQHQTQPNKPWSNGAMYQQQLSVAAQKHNQTVATANAKFNSNMAACNTKFNSNLGKVVGQTARNKRSGGNHTGLEKLGEFGSFSQSGSALLECQTRAKTAKDTVTLNAQTAYMAAEERLDAKYSKGYTTTTQAPARGGPATSSQQEAAKLAVCQKQELASLSGKKPLSPACQTILRNAPR